MTYNPVYSTGFIYFIDATPNTLFDVPEGYTADVRQFLVTTEAAVGSVALQVANGAGAPYITCVYLNVGGGVQSESWEGRIVVPGGGSIQIIGAALGLTLCVYVGGYLLTNSAP